MKEKEYVFRSSLSPEKFIESALSKGKINTSDSADCFVLMINTDHGGMNNFCGKVFADENNGSIITGKIVSSSFSNSNKKETLLSKIVTGL